MDRAQQRPPASECPAIVEQVCSNAYMTVGTAGAARVDDLVVGVMFLRPLQRDCSCRSSSPVIANACENRDRRDDSLKIRVPISS